MGLISEALMARKIVVSVKLVILSALEFIGSDFFEKRRSHVCEKFSDFALWFRVVDLIRL